MFKRAFALFLVIISLFSVSAYADETPEIFGKSAILIDADTGRVLFSKNPDAKVYPASTTKIMTAILVIENCQDKMGEIVVASEVVNTIIGTGASNIGILPGEEMTVEQLLYAVLLASANEACDVLAEYVSGGNVSEFVSLMNKKAEELGMENTNFVNTHGFHEDNHYTTARDMALLAKYAMQNETFRKIVKTEDYVLPKTNKYTFNGGERILSNTNDIIKPVNSNYYKYATGIKTGYTSQAGNCLVASATKESTKSATKSSMNLIAATFNSQSEDNDSRKNTDVINLFNYGFNNFSMVSVSVPNEEVGEVPVFAGNGADSVTAVVSSEVKALLPSGVDIKTDIKRVCTYLEDVKAPVKKGDKVGTIEYKLIDKKTGEEITVGEADLVAKTDISRNWFKVIFTGLKNILLSPFVVVPVILFFVLVLILIYMRNLRKKKRRRYFKKRRYR